MIAAMTTVSPAGHAGDAGLRRVGARVGVWSVAVATLILIGLSVPLYAAAPGTSAMGRTMVLTQLHALISALVGAIVVDRRGNLIGWLFCCSGLAWAIYHLAEAAARYALTGQQLAGSDLLIWATTWSSFLAFGLAPVLVLFLFPTGHLASPGWRWSFGIAVTGIVLGCLGYTFAPGPLEDVPQFNNTFGLSGAAGQAALVARELGWPSLLLSIFTGVISLRRRRQSATFEQRQQMKWLLLAGIVLGVFVCFWGINDLLGQPEVAASVAGLFLPLFPIALGIAILRHRLYDIDVLINRTLVYASLSAVLAGVYLAAVVLFQRVLSPVTAESNLAIAASTLAVAALFRPLRARIQAFIDRRFYREKYSAIATLEQFSTRLRNELDIDALETELLVVIEQTLHPVNATVWLKAAGSPA